MSKFVKTNNIQLHYLEKGEAGKPVLILMHGLTANAHSFDRIMRGLNGFHIFSVDLRGRGLSDKPKTNYTMKDHAADIIGMIEALGLQKVYFGGHSFGALLSIYLAANFPERVKKIVLIDAAARLNPNVKEMVAPSMLRLGKTWANMHDYFAKAKAAIYVDGMWNNDIENYYRADIVENTDGSVTTQSNLANITQAIEGALGLGLQWLEYIQSIEQPALLINATEPYGINGEPILPKNLALETVKMMKNCTYQHVSGNHLTMLFGKGADESAQAINLFLKK